MGEGKVPGSVSGEKPGRGDEPSVVVWHGEETPEGDPIEPEEQLAEVVQPIKSLVTIGNGSMREDVPLATLPREIQELAAGKVAHIAHQTSAGELAASVLQRCANCVHFDPAGWGQIVRRVDATGDRMQLHELNQVRAELAGSLQIELRDRHDLGHDGDMDLEHALKSLGLCKALGEHFKDTIIVTPINPCAMPGFFKAKRMGESRRAAASGYDWIMRRAQGRR